MNKTLILLLPMTAAKQLLQISYQSLLDLGTDRGINASGKNEIFGCIFGRDSAITVLMTLRAIEQDHGQIPDKGKLLALCRQTLLTISSLVGQEINDQTGEEPGKFVHEYRGDMVGPLGRINYDSLDATPLGLLAIYKYFELTGDEVFLQTVLPAVQAGLEWIMEYGDVDGDGLVEYEFNPVRQNGLHVQSWTDSDESLRQVDGHFPEYPIAPVEVQGYAYWALKVWGQDKAAEYLRKGFQSSFVFADGGSLFLAQALDGQKRQIQTITGNPLLLLWATHEGRAIIDKPLIDQIVHRSFQSDLFDPTAGIRTMSVNSPTFNSKQDSYHNGSFWPKLNGLVYEGLLKWDFTREARQLRRASLLPLAYFGTPIELYTKGADGQYLEYKNASGQVSCKTQAWSAAVMLDLLSYR